MISVVVPLYNEGEGVRRMLIHLRQIAGLTEVVLVDASDQPASKAIVDEIANEITNDMANEIDGQARGDSLIQIIKCPARARAMQMNAGAAHCNGAVLLFLHCDTRLPSVAAEAISRCIADGHSWGWFDLRLDGDAPVYRLIERMICWRARVCGSATGDQAMYIKRQIFSEQQGFALIPLMEDIELASRLKKIGQPGVIAQPVLTSARRWRKNGVLRTILLMWKLRMLYWFGVHPERLAVLYQNVR